jgi:hypothetical protein
MSNSLRVNEKRYGLFAVGFVIILAGIVAMFFWSRYFGPVVLLAGVYLVKVSKVQGLGDLLTRGGEHGGTEMISRPSAAAGNRPSAMMWVTGVFLLLVVGISYFILHEDAVHGGHQAWPADLFAFTGLVCGLYWSYLITKLTGM